MKIVLKDFQQTYASDLVKKLRSAARESRSGDLQAVSLVSATGSGKTAMVTAAIEDLLTGDADHGGIPDATFLWISDQPELNTQTRRKMNETSSLLDESRLVVVGGSELGHDELQSGRVYFINTQKLARDRDLVKRGDGRVRTFWDVVAATSERQRGRFFVVVDEAHRGMTENPRARSEANSIIQKFIKGSEGELPPVPVVVGISATPERFHSVVQGTTRTFRQVLVPVDAVRTSGLLKHRIKIKHPRRANASDFTLLGEAARRLNEYTERWQKYCSGTSDRVVDPVLVVQVQDGSGRRISNSDLGHALSKINDVIGPLSPLAVAHSFQEGRSIDVGGYSVRYIAPPDIDADPDVRVVFFKTGLNTGWDCPRAEVMMSFRTALDSTAIAQLVGRMVRAPLARQVEGDDFLNGVHLFLPHYDRKQLAAVVKELTDPDSDSSVGPVEIEEDDFVQLARAPRSDRMFAALESLPSYIVPSSRPANPVRRLFKLSRLLSNDGLDEDAPDESTALILKTIDSALAKARRRPDFKSVVDDRRKVELRGVVWDVLGELRDDDEDGVSTVDVTDENIDDLFAWAGRRLGEGLHKEWWRAVVVKDSSRKVQSKLELFALVSTTGFIDEVRNVAQARVQYLLDRYNTRIRKLSDAQRDLYDEVRAMASDPELSGLSYPASVEVRSADRGWARHLYVNDAGELPMNFKSSWETTVLEEVLARRDTVGWLRNRDRQAWSLRIPYKMEGAWKSLYPDFLIIRKSGADLVVDIVDPHRIDLADAPPKAAGLAEFAMKHSASFGRIELVMVKGDRIKRINLSDERNRQRAVRISTKAELEDLYESAK
ncbi:MAG TPA: DEAD/DEAH box helicase family protein [Acidimicrobiales bacterium]|nr:DEAD/DEAH box helicase family protein [Acidimicrobiales bacterium]